MYDDYPQLGDEEPTNWTGHYHDCAECGKLTVGMCGDETGMCQAPWSTPVLCTGCTPKPATVKVGYKWQT